MATDITGLNTKTSNNYEFNSVEGSIKLNEKDFKRFVLIINQTRGQTIYDINNYQYKGEQEGNKINLDYYTKSMSKDKLLIVYEYSNIIEKKILAGINEILDFQAENKKLISLLKESIY